MGRYVLSLNCGSSSLKFNLYKVRDNTSLTPEMQGIVEEIGNVESSGLRYSLNSEKIELKKELPTHKEALELLFREFAEHGIKIKDVVAIGHRVVHGGEKYANSILIDDKVINAIRNLIPLAPLHNPPNLTGIEEAVKLLPAVPQVAVFDTAFHATIPEFCYKYAIPGKWYRDYGVRKYGFHGTSHMYVSKRAAAILNIPYKEFNCITAHLGNGCSITKVQDGKSVDTSMGFTPLQGVIMGTRSGDIDPALIQHVANNLSEEEGIGRAEAYDRVFRALNKESGLKALGGTNMMQYIREKALEGDKEADKIIDIYSYRVAQYIGAYWATLPRTHAIVFTAGLGENEWYVRKRILDYLSCMQPELDDEKNRVRKKEIIIGRGGGADIMVIPTDEEIVIGYDALYIGYLGGGTPEKYPFEL
jgi:acetate kinase